MTAGIHHITLIARKVQANVDFYVGFLGLRLVKRTAGFEDVAQLHLIYGDATGSPGSLLTFLVWEDGSTGRTGHGQVSEVSLAIDPTSIGYWLTRGLRFGLNVEGPVAEFGEPTLRLKDPDGFIIKLVGVAGLPTAFPWTDPDVPAEHAIRRIRGATLLTEEAAQSRSFLERHFGYHYQASATSIERLHSASGDIVDIRDAKGFWPGIPGPGTADHIAFRAEDDAALERVHAAVAEASPSATNVHDRLYFRSLYVREPGGILFELATDAPGMLIDEPAETLGTALFVPGTMVTETGDLRLALPQFSMPRAERVIYRELPFVHRFWTPDAPDSTTLILLHGSGGSEASLMPLVHMAAPQATLLGVRGRATDEGVPRWFRRHGNLSFDQADIASEAEAFVAFIAGAQQAYGLDPARTVYVGQSNGANFLAALMLLHPGLIERAILLRPMPVLETPPSADLSGSRLLVVAGGQDSFLDGAIALAELLTAGGAAVAVETIDAGHDLAAVDAEVISAWLGAR